MRPSLRVAPAGRATDPVIAYIYVGAGGATHGPLRMEVAASRRGRAAPDPCPSVHGTTVDSGSLRGHIVEDMGDDVGALGQRDDRAVPERHRAGTTVARARPGMAVDPERLIEAVVLLVNHHNVPDWAAPRRHWGRARTRLGA